MISPPASSPIINETKGVRLIGALPAKLQRYQVYVVVIDRPPLSRHCEDVCRLPDRASGEGLVLHARSGMSRRID